MEQTNVLACLSALAQETRLDIYRLLVQAGADGLPVGQIAERLGLALPTLSFHLTQLRQAGLTSAERHGRSITYRADYSVMNALLGYLTENCCGTQAAACGVPFCEPAAANPGERNDETPARARRRQGSR
jgi:DNA-binding transcriptional ArsR family regulator